VTQNARRPPLFGARALSAEAGRRSLAGQPREEFCAMLADASTRAFDLLEPSLGDYGIRPLGG